MTDKNIETEVRFLEVDYNQLIQRLKELGAKDYGEELLTELMFSDAAETWWSENKFIRLRTDGKSHQVTYKHHQKDEIGGSIEVEIDVTDFEKAMEFLEIIGFVGLLKQEKKRHKFTLDGITFDFDTWPSAPTYLEIEASSEKELKKGAKLLNLDWKKVVYENARKVLQNHYNIPVSKLKYFTFNKIEER